MIACVLLDWWLEAAAEAAKLEASLPAGQQMVVRVAGSPGRRPTSAAALAAATAVYYVMLVCGGTLCSANGSKVCSIVLACQECNRTSGVWKS